MDWLDRMNGAMDYIEGNLAGEIEYEEAARVACCSVYHFQRMFSFITDMPLSEYIRRRRLTLAAFELQNSDIRIVDLALKYGYESPVSFARAFQSLHGAAPSLARDRGVQLKAYPRISFHISIMGDVEMNYRIEEKGPFKAFGVEEIIDNTNGNNFVRIPQFWQESHKKGIVARLAGIKVNLPVEELLNVNAIMCYRNMGENRFPYMIGVLDFDRSAEIPGDLTVIEVGSHTWAIFSTGEHTMEETAEKIQAVWKRIFSEWFPTSGYEHATGPDMELYYGKKNGRGYSEVWIPVVKK